MNRFCNKFSSFRATSTILWCCLIGMSVTSCDLASEHLRPDRSAGFEMQDYKDALAGKIDVESDNAAPVANNSSIPPLQPYIAAASDQLKPMPLVSISVNQTVPLKDVLFELAKQADYDIEMDAKIGGSIIFTARNKPFDLVVERICDLAGLRYTIEDGVLRVQVDSPYSNVYKINYLSFIRKNAGSVSNSVSVVSGDGADSGSTYSSSIESESDFWGELETNLDQILKVGLDRQATVNTPQISALAQAPNVKAIGIERDGITVQPPQATLQVQSLPTSSSASSSQNEGSFTPSFVLNKQAGLVNVYASERTHKEIKKYMKLLKRSVTAQVLIEAKILEVSLSDQFAAGIDWRFLNPLSSENVLGFSGLGTGGLNTIASGLGSTLPIISPNFVVGHAGNDFGALVQALSTFGTTRALASPRVTVINNQSAVLNVATNRVFFEVEIDVTTDTGVTTTDVSSEIRNVPEGVLVNVQPSIDLDNNTISMVVRPTITSVTRNVPDPAVAFAVAAIVAAGGDADGLENLIPEVNVQEIDSVVRVRSGQAIVMGGLLQDRIMGTTNGVPVLGELPMIGGLFRDSTDTVSKTELVIFLKATIIELPEDSIHETDRELYRKFSQDRRPLNFK